MIRVLFLYAGGRRARLDQLDRGEEAPREFLCGLPYLRARGYAVDLLELTELATDSPEASALRAHDEELQRRTRLTSTSHYFVTALERLEAADVLVAGNEVVGMGLAWWRRAGRLKTPFIYFGTGMLGFARADPPVDDWIGRVRDWPGRLRAAVLERRFERARAAYRQLVEASAAAVLFGKWDFDHACRFYPDLVERIHFIPFAVDTEFWRPSGRPPAATGPILFMGNDRPRDYDMVVRIARALPQFRFVFVTKVLRPEDVPGNVRLVAGDWKSVVVSDTDVRNLFHESALVVLPLKPTHKPSGQSVTLQAMASGTPVMLSRRDGFWEPDTVVDQRHVWFIHSGKVGEWCDAIQTLMQQPARRADLAAEARALVERTNTLDGFGRRLDDVVQRLVGQGEERVC